MRVLLTHSGASCSPAELQKRRCIANCRHCQSIERRMPDDYADEPYMWESVYELAVTEKNPEHRQQLLIAAQDAILQRARALQESGGSDLECTALEDAASFL